MTPTKTSVLISGAGPTGLSMACQLERLGIDFVIIDRNEKTTHLSKALVVHARSMEIFNEIGIADTAIRQGQTAIQINLITNGIIREQIQLGRWGEGLTQFPFMLILEQSKMEKLMVEHLVSKGRYVQWSSEFVQLHEFDDHVEVTCKNKDGAEQKIVADYLVGCDGAKSPVRKQLGFKFEGDTVDELFFVADVKIESKTFQPNNAYVNLSKDTFVLFVPMEGDKHFRLIGIVPDDLRAVENLQFEDIKSNLLENIQFELDFVGTYWFSTYKVHSRKTDSFGRGRCFIAGDAGHIHTPVGGQGMNTGIQDAYNLAWKLAFVIKGRADSDLLKTYSIERVKNAENLLRTTDRGFDFVTNDGLFGSFFRTYMMPFVAGMATKSSFIMKSVFPMISMLGIKYPHSPLTVKSHIGKIHAGDRMPYFEYQGHSIYEKLKEPNFKLLQFGYPAQSPDVSFKDFDLTQIDVVPDFFGNETDFYILLRPDNYISYIGREINKVKIL